MERKLASIKKIDNIKPIANADRVELAIIGGWQCVVGKNEFKIGDIGVYFEIDSILPIEERFEMLRKTSLKVLETGEEVFKLKTIEFRKEISQGLLMPLSKFPEIVNPVVGMDVTELLKIRKYEAPIPKEMFGVMKGRFPSFIQNTSIERIQNIPEYFELYKNIVFEETEKLDGSSTTFYYNNGIFGVCSARVEFIEESNSPFSIIANEIGIKQTFQHFGKNIAIQGELIGPKISNNPLRLNKHEFRVFSIFDINRYRYFDFNDRYAILKQMNNPNILHVPILRTVKIFNEHTTMESLLKHAHGTAMNPKVNREGLVYKSEYVDGKVIDFKVISNAYLL